SHFPYPEPDIQVLSLDQAFQSAYPSPPGRLVDDWPPQQAKYLRVYLNEMGCKTVVVEQHYVDRVFMHDEAVYYVRNLRNYPNYTRRLHFFTKPFDQDQWKVLIGRAGAGEHAAVQ